MAQSDTTDLYILALEYASKRLKEGVTYTELLTYLTDNHMPLEKKLLLSFQWWFFNNFYHPETFYLVKQHGDKNFSQIDFTQFYQEKMTLTAEAYEFYIRNKELGNIKQLTMYSNKISIKALKMATYSLWVTGGLVIVLILIALLGLFTG